MTQPTPPAPVDFDGYTLVFVIEGDGPGIWQLVRHIHQPGEFAACDGCSHEGQDRAYYRNMSLVDPQHDPQLIMCQVCIQRTWDERLDDRESPDPSGARAHVYPPVKSRH